MNVDLQYTALVRKAESLLANLEYRAAQDICEHLLARNRSDVIALSMRAHIFNVHEDYDHAARDYERCIALQPKRVDLQITLARMLLKQGRFAKAAARFEKARKSGADQETVLAGLAEVYERTGEFDKAQEILAPFVSRGTEDLAMAMAWARIALEQKNPQEALSVLQRHAAASVPPAFHFALGRAHEQAGDVEGAFHAYCAGNVQPARRFDLDQHIDFIARQIRTFTPALLKRLPRPQHDTSPAMFIAGRPRSGTTLLEKILDAHPEIAGVGELPHLSTLAREFSFRVGSTADYPESVADVSQEDVNELSAEYLGAIRARAPRAKRIVNKTLENIYVLGLINVLFPQSRVIHIRRDAVDNCWAMFVANLPNYGEASSLHTLGLAHGLYERLMSHWREALDLAMLEIDYEALVGDQEGWSRRIIEFTGLPWNDRCLRFYEEQGKSLDTSSRPTLSHAQVRQPIYNSAVGRAKKFEQFLRPLRDGLEEGRRIAATLG